MGLKYEKETYSTYSAQFKLDAVNDVLNNHLDLRETAMKHGVTRKMVSIWIQICLQYGPDCYCKSRTDKTVKKDNHEEKSSAVELQAPKPCKEKKKSIEQSSNKELLNEIKHFKMENAYL